MGARILQAPSQLAGRGQQNGQRLHRMGRSLQPATVRQHSSNCCRRCFLFWYCWSSLPISSVEAEAERCRMLLQQPRKEGRSKSKSEQPGQPPPFLPSIQNENTISLIVNAVSINKLSLIYSYVQRNKGLISMNSLNLDYSRKLMNSY